MSEDSGLSKEQIDQSGSSAAKPNEQAKIGRRSFLKKAFKVGVGAGVATAVGFPTARDQVENVVRRDDLQAEIDSGAAYLRNTYNINVSFRPPQQDSDNSEVVWKELSAAEQRNIIGFISKEASKYPPSYFKEYLNSISFSIVNQLRFQDEEVEGAVVTPYNFTKANEKPNYDLTVIYLNKNRGPLNIIHDFGWFDEHYFRERFHHELEHYADMRDKDSEFIDRWLSLHPEGMGAYIGGEYRALREVPIGFVSRYAQLSLGEDRAETAELLFSNYHKINELAAKDQILSQKIGFLKQDYYRRSSGRMNEQYWVDLSAGKVDDTYWNSRK